MVDGSVIEIFAMGVLCRIKEMFDRSGRFDDTDFTVSLCDEIVERNEAVMISGVWRDDAQSPMIIVSDGLEREDVGVIECCEFEEMIEF